MRWALSLYEWVQLVQKLQKASMVWVVAKYESYSGLDSMGTRRRMLTT